MNTFYARLVSLLLLAVTCTGFTFSNKPVLARSQRSHVLNVKRDILKMPTDTPQVPYKPPGSDYAQFIDIYSRFYRDRIMWIGKYIERQGSL